MNIKIVFILLCFWTILLVKLTTLLNLLNFDGWSYPTVNYFQDDQHNSIETYMKMSNIPDIYWLHKNPKKYYKNDTCAKYPTIVGIEFNNVHWQVLRTKNCTFYLYNAYYDDREPTRASPSIRILGMIDIFQPAIKTFCQLWFYNRTDAVVEETYEYSYIWYKEWGKNSKGVLQPYLISCKVPEPFKNSVPLSVSLVEGACDTSSTNLKVIYNKPAAKKDFVVCVKGLSFPKSDVSIRLVEWIELLSILGANKLVFYNLEVNRNIRKVLEHYERTGFVEVLPTTLPGPQPNYPFLQHFYLNTHIWNKRHHEVILYNDCLYNNLYSYNFIVLLDIDEVIVPKKDNKWKSLLDKFTTKAIKDVQRPVSSYCARNVYFFDFWPDKHGWAEDLPRHMHMLQHVYRSANMSRPFFNTKCFHDANYLLTLHNHFARECLVSKCYLYEIDTEEALLHHYRSDCIYKNNCEENYKRTCLEDTSIWKYKHTLIQRTLNTSRQLRLIDL